MRHGPSHCQMPIAVSHRRQAALLYTRPHHACAFAPRLNEMQNGAATLNSARVASKMDQRPSPTINPDAAAMHS